MRDRVAPEARGSAPFVELVIAGRRALLQGAVAALVCATAGTKIPLAAEALQRELRPSPDAAKPNFILHDVLRVAG